jgi:hypothetical protein
MGHPAKMEIPLYLAGGTWASSQAIPSEISVFYWQDSELYRDQPAPGVATHPMGRYNAMFWTVPRDFRHCNRSV